MRGYVISGKTVKQWSEITGLPSKLILARLANHYDISKILAPKTKHQVKRGSIKDFVYAQAIKQGVTVKAIYQRLNRGWTKQEVIRGYRKHDIPNPNY